MSHIDWSKAPEGATHFSPSCEDYYPCWCKWVDGSLFGWLLDGDSNWTRIRSQEQNQEKIKAMIARPIVEKWTGVGLPPVGTVCEWREKTGFSWVMATVLFITESSVVMQREDGFEWQMMTARTVFRPYRTPEQIAVEERANQIKKISDDLDVPLAIAIRAFDSGYRKFEIVENEE